MASSLPGRVLVPMLARADEALSLLVNPDSEHAELLPPEALDWLARTLSETRTQEAEAAAERFGPVELPQPVLALLVPALERRLRADAAMRSVLRRCFESAVARGEMATAWTPEQAATFLHTLIGGLINDWLRADGGFSLSHEVDQALEVFFTCLGAPAPQALSTHA